jgi:tetratricopeptide (TPR) repeat protein
MSDVLDTLGVTAEKRGELVTARKRYEEALDIVIQLGDVQGELSIRSNLGNILLRQGNHESAALHFKDSLRQLRQLEDKEGLAFALLNLSLAQTQLDMVRDAAGHLRESLGLSNELMHRELIAYCFEVFAMIALRENEVDMAAEFVQAAEDLYQETGIRLAPDEQEMHDSTQSEIRSRRLDQGWEIAASLHRLSVQEVIDQALSWHL